jgi:hypothetical protein
MSFFDFFRKKKNNSQKAIRFDNPAQVEELKIKAKSKVIVGLPVKNPAPDFITAIRDAAIKNKKVNELYLFSKKVSDSPVAPTLTVGVIFDAHVDNIDVNKVMNAIAEIINAKIPAGEAVDIIILKESELLNSVKRHAKNLLK